MKKIFTLLSLVFIAISVFAQAPEGIIYQAEARDNLGNIIENESLDVKITILENDMDGAVVWEGLHSVTTNKYGMFVLVIGTGTNTYGFSFNEISWGTNAHFLNVEVKTAGAFDWIDMGTTQFLSVPYALHAKTAESLVSNGSSLLKSAGPGTPSQTWSLFGNSKTDPEKDRMGTTDAADLVFITDNKERLRITKDGQLITADSVGLELGGNLKVHGDSVYIDKDLYVGRDVFLNFSDEFDPKGKTVNYGNFTVENSSSTQLTGTLSVDGETDLNSALNVNESSPTYLSGNLDVDGITQLKNDAQSTSKDDGSLVVEGGVGIEKNLNVGGSTNLNSSLTVENGSPTVLSGVLTVVNHADLQTTLHVADDAQFDKNLTVTDTLFAGRLAIKKAVPDGEFLATFENTNSSKGDGIKIQLGQRATKNNVGAYATEQLLTIYVAQKFTDKDFKVLKTLVDTLSTTESVTDALKELAIPTPEDLRAAVATACVLAADIGNVLITTINTELHLPLTTRDILVGINGFDPADGIPDCSEGALDYCSVGDFIVPNDDLAEAGPGLEIIPDIPTIPKGICDFLGEGYSLPKLRLNDVYSSNPLNKENLFIQFTDNSDWQVGAIKAQSIDDWVVKYLDPVFLYELYTTFKGLDKAKILPEMNKIGLEKAKEYLAIGVEYSSGNGDYAEWLERLDPNESIGTGDIVAVKAGKITKDLSNAEQIMAVSHRPIVLGNIPEEGKSHLGNNVAFMGQIPVKIMGAVASGDYIVGNSKIAGYGIAISPHKMTIDDFKMVVGRSWDTNPDNGPKMVNTVVGVHNGDYLNILKRYEQKFMESEARLESVEAKIDALSGLLIQASKND